jgi:hypothetical protein
MINKEYREITVFNQGTLNRVELCGKLTAKQRNRTQSCINVWNTKVLTPWYKNWQIL